MCGKAWPFRLANFKDLGYAQFLGAQPRHEDWTFFATSRRFACAVSSGYGYLVVETKRFVACPLEMTTKRRIAGPRQQPLGVRPHEAAWDGRDASRPRKAATRRRTPKCPIFSSGRSPDMKVRRSGKSETFRTSGGRAAEYVTVLMRRSTKFAAVRCRSLP